MAVEVGWAQRGCPVLEAAVREDGISCLTKLSNNIKANMKCRNTIQKSNFSRGVKQGRTRKTAKPK